VAERNWSTLEVAALTNIGADLAGVKIVGNNIRQVIEDRGRGLPTRVWSVSGTPTTGAVLIFFSGETGRVASVIAASDVSTADAAQVAGRVLLRGTFTEVHGARDPRRNLATATAHEIALDARTAEVTAVH
jgi:hypothetical protein